jgi:GNAT superfamily N-acetyltransferase
MDADSCVAIAQDLSEYFSADTHSELRASIDRDDAWVAEVSARLVGFLVARVRYPRAAEITHLAVRREAWHHGTGTALLSAALQDLQERGVVVVEVKTLDATAGYGPYAATREFWRRRGFVQIDCIDPLPGWQPGNPSAILVAALRPTR